MSKILLRVGGLINLLFVVFHLAMVKSIGKALLPLSSDIRATVSTLNIHMVFILLVFAYLAIFRWRDLLTTRLGNIMAIAISLFWFLRAINQVVFYELTPADIPLLVLCLVFGLLHLIPVFREWKNVPSEAQPQIEKRADMTYESQGRFRVTRWPSYAVVAWCAMFGALHLYWVLGGTAGFAELSMPSNRMLALTRDPLYVGITWGVVIACVFGAIVALAPFQTWSRRIPRWLLLTPLWIACGLFFLRGFGTLIQSALMIAGGMPFDPISSWPDAQAWFQYLLIDAVFYSPWFILGGFAFGATAWSARRYDGERALS
jgi:Protein of unknown function (DUF3995)